MKFGVVWAVLYWVLYINYGYAIMIYSVYGTGVLTIEMLQTALTQLFVVDAMALFFGVHFMQGMKVGFWLYRPR